ncbi:MAG: SGNH/GDSL hydrolase family protein [Catenulispora sp.]|nr:SGNH/GDSL hydrolase family protein [Catenulispora sp.]
MTDLIAENPATSDLTRAAELLAGAPWKRFAVLGDSTAAGIREVVDGYPDKSWSELFTERLAAVQPGLAAHNFGQKGLLTREVRAKQLAPALEFQPDLAVILCGGNDLLRGSFDGVADEFDTIVGGLREQGATVVTMSLFDITKTDLLPEDFKPALRAQLDEMYALLDGVAARHDTVHLHFGGHPSAAEPGIYASDYQHLTTHGHAVVAAELVRRLAEQIG